MSFNVTFYTFTKKANSTAQPSASGSTYACVGKSPLSVTSPRLQLKLADGAADNPAAWNYAYIPSFSRYYWVSEWTNTGPIWEASLSVDALASWKTNIGNLSLYVFRSSYSYNLRLTDTLYPQLITPRRLKVTLPKVWTVGGANEPNDARNTCSIVAGIISGNSTKYYAFTPTNWARFYNGLFSQDYYNAVLGAFGATEYPEAKVAINPLQYITGALLIPWGIGASRFQIDYVSSVSSITVGNAAVTSSPAYTAYVLNDEIADPWNWYIQLGSDFWHPQTDERGDWLKYAPYTEYTLFFPPIGNIQLEPSLIADAEYIRFYMYTDFKAGTGMLEVIADYGSSKTMILSRVEFALGASIQLANVTTPGVNRANAETYNLASALYGGGGSFASNMNQLVGKIPIIGQFRNNGIESAIHGLTPHLSTRGSFGSLATMGGVPRLDVTQWYLANDDLAGRGRPLADIRQLSTIPGYISADADEVQIPCTASELNEIKNAIAEGFYYE